MTDDTPDPPPEPASDAAPKQAPKTGDRIAKVLARAGLASRRDAEKLIAAGRVSVNGRIIDSPALDIGPKDRVTVDGQPIPEAEPPRLWLYHKPAGLVTTEKDEEGRPTVFDNLPEGLPRVMSVGRLDITSEGLLLLTNDGEIKRRLELPSTGWLRKYRVRVNGTPDDASLEPLRQGITVDDVAYQPMQVVLDRQQGANAWLTVGLREGKNREVRRAMEAVGLTVNRLIRISYGPFRLEDLEPGQVEEVRPRVLRDQLGLDETPGSGRSGAAKAGRTVRTLKPVAAEGAGSSVKPGFAPRTGKADWLADPSASGRPRAGTKGPGSKGAGKPRAIDDTGLGDTPRARKPATAGSKPAGKPRAAGTRSASVAGKGPARPRPAWGDAPRDPADTAEVPRLRKPRATRAGAGGSAPPSRDDRPPQSRARRDAPDSAGKARPPRSASGSGAGKSAGRPAGKPSAKAYGASGGDRGPGPAPEPGPKRGVRPARAAAGDDAARATARPSRSPTGSRSGGDGADRPPRSGARSWGAKSHAAAGPRGARDRDHGKDEGRDSSDAPRPPRARAQDAGAGGTRARTSPGGTPRGDRARPDKAEHARGSADGKGPRGERTGTGGARGPRTSGKPVGDRPLADRPSGGGGGRSGGPPGARTRGNGPKATGPGTGGPRGGGPRGSGPAGSGPKGSGPKGGGPRGSGRKGGGPKGGGSSGGGRSRG